LDCRAGQKKKYKGYLQGGDESGENREQKELKSGCEAIRSKKKKFGDTGAARPQADEFKNLLLTSKKKIATATTAM